MIAVRAAAVALGLALAGCGGAGSPSPGPIVFAANPDGYGSKLMAGNADGSGFRRLTWTDPELAPGLSPDGKKVLLERTHEEESAACGLPACAQIWVADAGGGGARPLTAKDEDAEGATWSPEGERIAFSKRDLERENDALTDFQSDIYVMNRDGSDETQLTDRAGVEESPTWSPDGEQIAFSTSTGEEGDIYVMNSDGTEVTRLTDLPGVEIEPVWSPDGERIAFSTEWIERADVYVMNSDGSELRRLTDPAVGESSPAWSPEGDMLAFYRETDEGAKIVIARGRLRSTRGSATQRGAARVQRPRLVAGREAARVHRPIDGLGGGLRWAQRSSGVVEAVHAAVRGGLGSLALAQAGPSAALILSSAPVSPGLTPPLASATDSATSRTSCR